MTHNVLEASNLSKSYLIDGRRIMVLDGIDLAVTREEFVVVEGKSGSGKSTLLALLSGLDRPDTGKIVVDRRDITGMSEDQLAPFRNRTIGYVFQSFHLVPSLTALENIMFPAQLRRAPDAAEQAEALLVTVNLLDRKNSFPHQLSGGEKQRVAICRALINSPTVLFADEPTGNLDSANGDIVLDLLGQLRSRFGTSLILATHSREIAARADRVVRLEDGRIAMAQAG